MSIRNWVYYLCTFCGFFHKRAKLIYDLQNLLNSILILSCFWNHVTFNLTKWTRQIGPKCSIKGVFIYLLLNIWVQFVWFMLSNWMLHDFIWVQFVCIVLFLLHDAKLSSSKGTHEKTSKPSRFEKLRWTIFTQQERPPFVWQYLQPKERLIYCLNHMNQFSWFLVK